jgi:hypothetical protein
VLIIEVRDRDAVRSKDEASRLAQSYLVTRRGYLSNRRDQALSLLREQLAGLRGPSGNLTTPADITRARLERAVTAIVLTPTLAGEVIRTRAPAALRRQSEVAVTSGAALGFAAGALVLAVFPGWQPGRRPGRRWARRVWGREP